MTKDMVGALNKQLSMADLGGKSSTTAEFEKGNPQYDATLQAADLQRAAAGIMGAHLGGLAGVGTNKLKAGALADASRSVSDRMDGKTNDDGLPVGPGFAYATHLFRNIAQKRKREEHESRGKDRGKEQTSIYTDQIEALKTALSAMGIYSEKNPGGIPIDVKEAKKAWFGDKDVDPIQEAEWRSLVEMGDRKIDSKRMRKFVNYDGSLTWELLNEDKTVMSRFTVGEYAGMKIFAQGGYSKFAELLKQVKQQKGPDHQGVFESIRGMFGGQ